MGIDKEAEISKAFTVFWGTHFSTIAGAPLQKHGPSRMSTPQGRHVLSFVGVATGFVQGASMNSSPWLKRTDGVERGVSLRDPEAEELPIPVRAACNVWLNFLSN